MIAAAGEVHQRLFHHPGAGHVQVIGRLIEDQHLRPGEQALRQRHSRAFWPPESVPIL